MDQTKDNNTTNIPQSEETVKAQPQSQSHEASQAQPQTSYAVRPNRRTTQKIGVCRQEQHARSQKLAQHRIYALRHRRCHTLDPDG